MSEFFFKLEFDSPEVEAAKKEAARKSEAERKKRVEAEEKKARVKNILARKQETERFIEELPRLLKDPSTTFYEHMGRINRLHELDKCLNHKDSDCLVKKYNNELYNNFIKGKSYHSRNLERIYSWYFKKQVEDSKADKYFLNFNHILIHFVTDIPQNVGIYEDQVFSYKKKKFAKKKLRFKEEHAVVPEKFIMGSLIRVGASDQRARNILDAFYKTTSNYSNGNQVVCGYNCINSRWEYLVDFDVLTEGMCSQTKREWKELLYRARLFKQNKVGWSLCKEAYRDKLPEVRFTPIKLIEYCKSARVTPGDSHIIRHIYFFLQGQITRSKGDLLVRFLSTVTGITPKHALRIAVKLSSLGLIKTSGGEKRDLTQLNDSVKDFFVRAKSYFTPMVMDISESFYQICAYAKEKVKKYVDDVGNVTGKEKCSVISSDIGLNEKKSNAPPPGNHLLSEILASLSL